jgi:CubicO group peptidase (beta-lactamase class C family)
MKRPGANLLLLSMSMLSPMLPAVVAGPAKGPLRVHPQNGRYFTDGTKLPNGSLKAVYLTGSHTWANLIDRGPSDPPPAFDFEGYLDFLETNHHNFIRLWARHVSWYHGYGDGELHAAPLAWTRSGPGKALDGKPKFDLGKFNPAYFDRLRARVMAARNRGIYVSIMLFGGSYECRGGWQGNPFNAQNNVNSINGDLNNDGNGLETQTLEHPAMTRLQEAYVRKVIETINDLDNVLYEISNESEKSSAAWQHHFIRFIHNYEASKAKQHPVGMTALYVDDAKENNRLLLASPADWISPHFDARGVRNVPAAGGTKVSILDSDHWFVVELYKDAAFGREWVWKSFCRGHHPILMEHLPPRSFVKSDHPLSADDPGYFASRKAMGFARRLVERMGLGGMTPRSEMSSTRYCLADPGRKYLVYQPVAREAVSVELERGSYRYEWFDAVNGMVTDDGSIESLGGAQKFTPSCEGDAVLVLEAQSQSEAAGAYFPPPESKGGWRKLEKPEEIRRIAGMNPAKLGLLKEWLWQSDGRDFAAVVIRRGQIVLEVERGNSSKTDARRVASVSKAICATVLALASEQSQRGLTPRKMSFDDPAFDFIPWAKPLSDARKAKITVKQLLNHTSGICPEATGAPNDGTWEYILGQTGDERTAKLAFDPGGGCGYSTHALHHAALVCETVTGMPYDQFAIQTLFKPLGIEHWWFQYFDSQKHGRHPTHGVGMPARDLARIAYCMLREGRWNDRQVIPKWFVEQTAGSTHEVKSPEMRWKLNPQVFSHGWELPARHSGESGRSGAGIPADARAKPGSGGQLIAFVPSLDLVVTRQTGSSGDWQFEEYLRRACAAVE